MNSEDINEPSLGLEFEKLCAEILKFRGFEVRSEYRGKRGHIDILAKKGGEQVAVEVKLYRSKIILPNIIERAVDYICDKGPIGSIRLVIVSSVVTEPLKAQMLAKRDVHVWDIVDLFNVAFDHPDSYYKLARIFNRATTEKPDPLMIVVEGRSAKLIDELLFVDGHAPSPLTKFVSHGEKLCRELKAIAEGKGGDSDEDIVDKEERDAADKPKKKSPARLYEEKCKEILEYLFKDHLTLWDFQHSTDGGIHKFDLICRIASLHNFWIDLSKDFNTRYVLFEFKNYKNKITQGQIYTTEKYLFNRGLRTVAFIISRKGPDKNAQIAAKGALRENGKLIVNLTDDELCKMLHIADGKHEADRKEDPTEVLIEVIDSMLTSTIR